MASIFAKGFDLAKTIRSGQVFRYEEDADWFSLNEGSSFFKVRQEGDMIIYSSTGNAVNDGFMRLFFSLDEQPSLQAFKTDGRLLAAFNRHKGLRIIRQDPWQCLISFVISQNCNIPRIKKNIETISARFGKVHDVGGKRLYAFPERGSLRKGGIDGCGLGYRARYVEGIDKISPDLESLRKLPYKKAKESLLSLPGVGDKVADCVLLFSLGFREAFPVDVHIRRVMQDIYFDGEQKREKDIADFARERFGKHAGIVQQYLFYDQLEK